MSTTSPITTVEAALAPLGSLFLSVAAQTLLQGVLISQSGEYFSDYWTDSFGLKFFVGFTMLLSLLHTASLVAIGWSAFVTRLVWGASSEPSWLLTVQPVLAGAICALVQSFLIRRCWKILDRRLIVVLTLGFLLLLAVMSSTFWTVCFGLYGPLTTKRVVKNLAIAWAVFSLIVNITANIIISGYVVQQRTGLAHLDALLRRVSRFTWESALLPSLCMIAAVCVAFLPTDGFAVGICMAVAAKLECIVLMRTLNARAKLRVQAVSGKGLGRQSLPNSPLDLTVIPGYETFEPTPSPTSSTSEHSDPAVEVKSMKHYLTGRSVKLRSLEDVIRHEFYDEQSASDAEVGQSSNSNSPKQLQSLMEVLQAEKMDTLELPGPSSGLPRWLSKRNKVTSPPTLAHPLPPPRSQLRADSDPSPVAGPSGSGTMIRARTPSNRPPSTP